MVHGAEDGDAEDEREVGVIANSRLFGGREGKDFGGRESIFWRERG